MSSPPLVQATIYAGVQLMSLYVVFLRPMAEEAIDMDLKQIDPTDIVLIPYGLRRLAFFIGMTLTALWVIKGKRLLQNLLPLSILYWLAMIISGASPTQHFGHTVLAALYSTALVLSDPPIFGSPQSSLDMSQELVYRFRGTQNSPQALLARTVSQLTIAVTVLLQILRLYDRGWQVQRWPVPVILGSACGWSIGVVVGAFWASRQRKE